MAIVLTASSLGAAIAFAPADIPRLHEVEVNGFVVWFAIVVALAVTVIGVVSRLRGSAGALASALKDGALLARSGPARRALVVAEIALTVVLLVGAGLLARSFAGLQRVDPGFEIKNLLVLRIAPDVTRYRGQSVIEHYNRVLDLDRGTARRRLGRRRDRPAHEQYRFRFLSAAFGSRAAAPTAMRTAGKRANGHAGVFQDARSSARRGPRFSAQDETTAPRVIIINESLALECVAWLT